MLPSANALAINFYCRPFKCLLNRGPTLAVDGPFWPLDDIFLPPDPISCPAPAVLTCGRYAHVLVRKNQYVLPLTGQTKTKTNLPPGQAQRAVVFQVPPTAAYSLILT